jgi:hypothetical protein
MDSRPNRVNSHRMGVAIFTTGPYIEMSIAKFTIFIPKVEDGIVTWRIPVGNGAVVHVSLDDCEVYGRWLFDHPERSNGMDLEVAIDHIYYVKAFEKVTGHPARYIDTDLDTYWKTGNSAVVADSASAYNADPEVSWDWKDEFRH